jgi:PAS domain-containing protein
MAAGFSSPRTFFRWQLNQLLIAFCGELLSRNDRKAQGFSDGCEGETVKHVVARMPAMGSAPRRPSLPLAAGFTETWLFAAASQAVMIVELASGNIVEANPAAAALLDSERTQLLGSSFLGAFDADSTPALAQMIATVRRRGHIERVIARTRGRSAARGSRLARWARAGRDIAITLSLVSAESDAYMLVRLLPAARAASDRNDHGDGDGARDSDTRDASDAKVPSLVLDAIDKAPEGFVVTDPELRLSYANRAFIRMAGLDSLAQLQGNSLTLWLELTQADLTRLNEQMARREAVTVFNTTLRRSSLSTRGASLEVEVSAIAVPDGRERSWGFRISAGGQSAAA